VPAMAPFSVGLGLGVVLASLIVRIGATLRHFGRGLRSLPRNFRRLTLCTSPAQEPELVPGLQAPFTLPAQWQDFQHDRRSANPAYRVLAYTSIPILIPLWFLPGWLYRITLKSTAWFWWPLAFLGGDLRRVQRPELFRQHMMSTLLAK